MFLFMLINKFSVGYIRQKFCRLVYFLSVNRFYVSYIRQYSLSVNRLSVAYNRQYFLWLYPTENTGGLSLFLGGLCLFLTQADMSLHFSATATIPVGFYQIFDINSLFLSFLFVPVMGSFVVVFHLIKSNIN